MRKDIKIIIPKPIDEFLGLVKNIIEKHEEEGASSVLLNQANIDMPTMKARYLEAAELHETAIQLEKDMGAYIDSRNVVLGMHHNQNTKTPDTLLFFVTSIRDELKGNCRGEWQKIGDWGYEVIVSAKGTVRIPIPYQNPDKMIALCGKILKKHDSDGANS